MSSVTAVGALTVRLGPGNSDQLTITSCTATTALLDGGGNTGDTLVKSRNHFVMLVVTGFQHVIG
jgi:hypothetical protein